MPAKPLTNSAKNPGPIVVGAVQGASCYGPAYEFCFILETELRRRKIRDQVQITYVSPEPYVGHLGLDGVGDTKGLLEGAMRDKHVKWMTNTKVNKVEPGVMHVETMNTDGTSRWYIRIAVQILHDAPRFPWHQTIDGH